MEKTKHIKKVYVTWLEICREIRVLSEIKKKNNTMSVFVIVENLFRYMSTLLRKKLSLLF